MNKSYLFTSESVSEGHPDKIADQISDAILDAILSVDPAARVAAETLCKSNLVVLAGEISTTFEVNYEKIVRDVLKGIGYKSPDQGIDSDGCRIEIHYDQQSDDIARGIISAVDCSAKQGAGDQGIMFGYACDETPALMPFAIYYAHRLVERQAQLRRNGKLPWLRPDAKSQLTIRYQDGYPKEIVKVVLSTQHDPDVSQLVLKEAVVEEIIKPVLPSLLLTNQTEYLINPSGRFVIGGPRGDCGLTGRKIIVDTYGGASPHGGGAFSGKDPSKVDRSAAYVARYIAKNVVASGLARQCQIQLSYAIGCAEPLNVSVYTEGTGRVSDCEIVKIVKRNFALDPEGIIRQLDLLRPIYKKTSVYGHFGRCESEFTWEKIDKISFFS